MKILELSIRDLRDYHDGIKPWPWNEGILPISKQRVYAHINNPRASDEDIALLVGYKGDELVSYLGVLPDLIFLDGAPSKIGWLTTWWIKPGNAGSGSLFLLMRAIKLYSGKIGVSEYSESAASIYAAMKNKFKVITPRVVGLWHIRPDMHRRLLARFGSTAPIRAAGAISNTLVDLLYTIRSWIWEQKHSKAFASIRFEYIGTFDSDTQKFLNEQDRSNELFLRGVEELSWLIHYPWTLQTPLIDSNVGRYWFTSNSRKQFLLTFRLLRPDGSIGGLIILSHRQGLLKVPYSFIDQDMTEAAAMLICWHIRAVRARGLFLLDERLKRAMTELRYPHLHYKEIQRRSLVTVDLDSDRTVYMHDGDGDCAFT